MGDGLAATYSPASWDAVPSARRGLTAGFGMGPGVSLALWPPDLESPREGAFKVWQGPEDRRQMSGVRGCAAPDPGVTRSGCAMLARADALSSVICRLSCTVRRPLAGDRVRAFLTSVI